MKATWAGTLFDQQGYSDLSTAQTRHEAEQAIKPSRANLRERVFACIKQFGPVTDEQIAELAQLKDNTVRPRRLELHRDGRIEAAGYSHTKSGRKAVAWRVA